MSITVEQCLKLPALQEAVAVGGRAGLDRIVTAVSVLEHTDASMLKNNLFIGNELLITAFITIKDDVEKQCETFAKLNEQGASALVLYYVGIFVPEVDKRLIALADELHFPLLVMPSNCFDFRYGEVISEVLEAVFKDQSKEVYFVSSMLERISALPARHRGISTVMRMLSDRLRCSLVLADRNMTPVSEASWPMSAKWDYTKLTDAFLKGISQSSVEGTFEYNHEGKIIFVTHVPILSKNKNDMNLFVIYVNEKPDASSLEQTAELINLYLNFWDYSYSVQNADEIIKAILGDEPLLMRRIAQQMQINIADVHTMWVLKERQQKDSKELKQINMRRALMAKLFLQQSYKLVLADSYDDDVVLFLSDLPYSEMGNGLPEQLMENIENPQYQPVLACFSGLEDTRSVRNAYLLLQECRNILGIIYPSHRIIGFDELYFAQKCKDILDCDPASVKQQLKPLENLFLKDKSGELIETLTIFLLDAGGNMQKTGELMFLHKNTIKYRLHTIKELIGSDITKLPKAYNLYLAVALHRLRTELFFPKQQGH